MEFPLWDEQWFWLINREWRSEWLDVIMPYWRHKLFWMPFYFFLAAFLWFNFRQKALYFLLGAALTIGIADMTSSQLIKKSVERLRPCNDQELKEEVNLLVRCGGGYSFTSSHATNHFALAFFFLLTLGRRMGGWRWLFLFWAASIAYGQVYVGVHYPVDVLVGAMIGSMIGIGVAFLYKSLKGLRISYFYEKESRYT